MPPVSGPSKTSQTQSRTQAPPTKPPPPKPGQTYQVQKGDTLSGIAKKAYGDASRWKEIAEANPRKVGPNALIKAGDTIKIPADSRADKVEKSTRQTEAQKAVGDKPRVEDKGPAREGSAELKEEVTGSFKLGKLADGFANATRLIREAGQRASAAADESKGVAEQKRVAAGKAQDKVRSLEAQLDKARADAQSTSLDHFRRVEHHAPKLEVDNAARRSRDAQNRVGSLEKQLDTARADAIKKGDEAIRAQQDANQKAKAVGRKEPFPDANGVKDARDAGSLSTEAQKRLLGSPGVVSPQEAAKVDAQKIADATAQGPEQGARALEEQLQGNRDPAYREELLRAAQPSVTKIAADLDKLEGKDKNDLFKNTMGSLSRATELAGAGNARLITDAYAKGLPDGKVDIDDKDRLGGSLKQSIQDGNGSLFATELAGSLQRNGKTDAARDVAKLTAEAVGDINEDFKEKADQVDKLNGELARYVSEWKGVLSDAELQKGIEAFREKNKAAYTEFEDAGRKLSSTLEGAGAAARNAEDLSKLTGGFPPEGVRLLGASQEALKELPRAAQSDAGQKAIADSLERAGAGAPSFLENARASQLGLEGDEAKAHDQALTDSVTRAAGTRAAELAQSGDLGRLGRLVEGMDRNASTLGLKSGDLRAMKDVVADYQAKPTLDPVKFGEDFAKATTSVAKDAVAEQLKSQYPGLSDDELARKALETPTGKRIATIGLVVSGASIAKDLATGDAETRIKAVADTLGLAGDLAPFLKEGSKLSGIFKTAGTVARPLGVIFDGVNIAQAVKNKDYAQAGISAASLAGTLAAGAVGGPAGIAIAAGTAVFTIGANAVLNHFRANAAEDRAEENLGVFLKGAGLSETAAYRFRDVTRDGHESIGRMISQAAPQLGVTPRQLLDQLSRLDSDTLKKVVDTAESVPRDDDGVFRATHESDSRAGEELAAGRYQIEVKPQSVTGWVNWLRHERYISTPSRSSVRVV
ncbi:MAG: LysM peptidoglycan-binding domain-containing protein [Myxococcota bacterium]